MAKLGQLELQISREPQPDRNHLKGGRSFYFFDIDDNVLFLSTSIFVFHRTSGHEVALTTAEFAKYGRMVGKEGAFADYELRLDDETGSFRRFRDANLSSAKIAKEFFQQPFVEDLAEALGLPDFKWKGPSWNCFYHACFNQRPVSLITARGHHPDTIRSGLQKLVSNGHLPMPPNYLSVFPVSNPGVRRGLGDAAAVWSVSRLKQEAIIASVHQAMNQFGLNPYHRFGMSDDSPENLELIIDAMRRLKTLYPENGFFVIDTHQDRYIKQEIFLDHIERQELPPSDQLQLF